MLPWKKMYLSQRNRIHLARSPVEPLGASNHSAGSSAFWVEPGCGQTNAWVGRVQMKKIVNDEAKSDGVEVEQHVIGEILFRSYVGK